MNAIFGFVVGTVLMTVTAFAFILPALRNRRAINRDDSAQQNIQLARRRLAEMESDGMQTEIESALLDDLSPAASKPVKQPSRFSVLLIVVLIPLLSAALYLQLGNPAALSPASLPTVADTPSLTVLLAQLEQKLADNPADAEGWTVAAKTYLHIGRYADAARAYQMLHQLVGDRVPVLTGWAHAELLANAGVFSAPIRARVAAALAIDPGDETALWLKGLMDDGR